MPSTPTRRPGAPSSSRSICSPRSRARQLKRCCRCLSCRAPSLHCGARRLQRAAFAATAHAYQRLGFRDFKLKLSGDLERDTRKLALLDSADSTFRVRADANNLWADVHVAEMYLRNLGRSFVGLEEPLIRDATRSSASFLRRSDARSSSTRVSPPATSSASPRARPIAG